MGIDVVFELISDNQQNETEIMNAIQTNAGTASLCTNYNYGTFSSFTRIIGKYMYNTRNERCYIVCDGLCFGDVLVQTLETG